MKDEVAPTGACLKTIPETGVAFLTALGQLQTIVSGDIIAIMFEA